MLYLILMKKIKIISFNYFITMATCIELKVLPRIDLSCSIKMTNLIVLSKPLELIYSKKRKFIIRSFFFFLIVYSTTIRPAMFRIRLMKISYKKYGVTNTCFFLAFLFIFDFFFLLQRSDYLLLTASQN